MTATPALPKLDSVTLPWPVGVDIEDGDLCFVAPASPALSGLTVGAVYPATSMNDQGSTAANQRLFAKLFAGVSKERHLTGDLSSSSPTNENTHDVSPVWVGDMTCASTAWRAGDLVGVAENGGSNGILSTTVAKVTDRQLAIGICVQDTAGVSVTTVRVALFSELFSATATTSNNFNIGGPVLTASATAGAATLNAKQGTITSEALTTAAGSIYTLTLTNSSIYADSIVLASADNGTNTRTNLIVQKITPSAGSVTIDVKNDEPTNALNGTIKLNFFVA